MRIVGCVSILVAIAGLSRAAAAQAPHVIEGSQPCNYNQTFYNQDVIIRDVALDGCAPCSFSVTVYNGTITVEDVNTGFGIDGAGTDGTHAVMGDVCVVGDNVAAGPATAGCNITLRSLKPISGPATRPLGVFVNGTIDVHGGNGGQGAHGNSDVFLPWNCGRCGPDNGLSGTAGANGGSVAITSNGPVIVQESIQTFGGDGGFGGGGGGAQYGNGAGLAAAGSKGGSGGAITITQSLALSAVQLFGSLDTSGGNGGEGGFGGGGSTGAAGVTKGAPGGNGGNGGAIKVVGFEINALGSMQTSGGFAGSGGFGGASPSPGFSCLPCRDDNYETFCSTAIQGGAGADGGAGGNAGTITLSTGGAVTLGIFSSFTAMGGNGGAGGMGGQGSSGYADCGPCPGSCEETCNCGIYPSCPLPHAGECPAVAANGPAGAGGAGGNGAAIVVKALTIFNQAPFNTQGGCGGAGATGHSAQCVIKCSKWISNDDGQPCCCTESLICSVVEASPGAPGGAGGKGGSISLSLSIAMTAPLPTFEYCGGGGGRGGDGGNGFTCPNGDTFWIEPGDSGGLGGLAGSGGTFTYPPGPSAICVVPRIDCDPQVLIDGDIIKYRGAPGQNGSNAGCACNEF